MTISKLLAVSTAILPAAFAAPAPSKPLKLPEIKYEKFIFPNGLTVITQEDHRLLLVAVDLWYHDGPSTSAPAAPASPTSSST